MVTVTRDFDPHPVITHPFRFVSLPVSGEGLGVGVCMFTVSIYSIYTIIIT